MEKIIRNELKSLQLDEEQEDDFDASEADEEQFNSYMIKTFGEKTFKNGYAFVVNFRENIAYPATRERVSK